MENKAGNTFCSAKHQLMLLMHGYIYKHIEATDNISDLVKAHQRVTAPVVTQVHLLLLPLYLHLCEGRPCDHLLPTMPVRVEVVTEN